MALELTTDEPTFIDLFNGVSDLQKRLLKHLESQRIHLAMIHFE